MQNVLLVGMGGFFGALARWYLGGVIAGITGSSFPWGTMLINVTGAFVLGFLFAASTERGIIDPAVRLPVMVGFLGAYTTFSTLMLETWRLVEGGSWILAAANMGGSVLLGTAAVVAGMAIGRLV